jgi:hypothetical protein
VRFQVGRFVDAEPGVAVFALPNSVHRDRCQEVRTEVEQALGAHFGRRIPLRLIIESEVGAAVTATESEAAGGGHDYEDVDLDDLRDAPPGTLASPLDHVMQVFEGAQVVED